MWMLLIIFVAFFAAVLLVGYAVSVRSSKELEVVATRLEVLTAPQSIVAKERVLSVRRDERLSTLPWLDELLRKIDLTARLKLLLYQAEVTTTVGRVLLWATFLAVAAGYLVYFRTGAFFLGFVVGVCAGSLPFIYVLGKRQKRFDMMVQLLPDALDLMTGAIRAGHTFSSAMSAAARECPEPIRREFRQCFDEQNYGLELRGALANLQYRVPVPEIRMIVTAVLIQSESGGNLTEILENVAYLIRENFRLRRQIRVHTAQGRISGIILTVMPIILGFLLYLMTPDQMSLLWTHPIGRKCMYSSLVMTAIGGLCIRKIVRIRI